MDPWLYYGHSKLCNVLFTRELARRLEAMGGERRDVYANVVHPGFVVTNLFRHVADVYTNRGSMMRPMVSGVWFVDSR